MFGDPITVRCGAHSQLAVYLWRSDGCEPSIFLDGRVHPATGLRLQSWACPRCHNSRIFWAVRIPPRCGRCHPPTTVEREHLFSYAVACVEGLAAKLDDPTAKTAMHRLLDETVSTGDVRQLVALSLECLAGGFTLKHHGGQS